MQTPAGALGMARECKSERLWHCGVNLPLAQRTRYLSLSYLLHQGCPWNRLPLWPCPLQRWALRPRPQRSLN